MLLFHAADLHLGRRRLDGRIPDTDLRDAFAQVAEAAISAQADALLLAGDLFDQPQVQPQHLRQAQEVLGRLREAGIPVMATEGNHDTGFAPRRGGSWLDYLSQEGDLHLLTTRFDAQGALLLPWDPTARSGSYLDFGGIRFVGAGYLGAATPHKIRQIAHALDPASCHVLLLHAGPDYFVGEGGGFSTADLRTLRERVTYVALGHIHRPMIHAGWACNPGSPENMDHSEARYDLGAGGKRQPRGYARVHIDPAQRHAPTELSVIDTRRRPVLEVSVDCTPFGNKLKGGEDALVTAATAALRHAAAPPHAVAVVHFHGELNLRRIPVDRDRLADSIAARAPVLAAFVDLSRLNLDTAASTHGPNSAVPPRETLERQAIQSLVDLDPFWAATADAPLATDLFLTLKDFAHQERSAADVAETLVRHPLVDRVLARSTPASEHEANTIPTPSEILPPASQS